jgi:hypothetical protein
LDGAWILVAVTSAILAGAVWYLGSFMPNRLAPSAGISGLAGAILSVVLANALPTGISPGEISFVGPIFVVICTVPAALFWLVFPRSSDYRSIGPGTKD